MPSHVRPTSSGLQPSHVCASRRHSLDRLVSALAAQSLKQGHIECRIWGCNLLSMAVTKLTLISFTSLPVVTARLQRHLSGDATNPVKSYAMPADCF